MKATIKITKEVNFTHLKVKCGPRYWEDATVNGVEDTNGTLMPARSGEYWCPVINIDTGVIENWPQGTTAKVHYKVCDDGEYWLMTDAGTELKYPDYYVPDVLDVSGESFGDYVILEIDETGKIANWPERPNIDSFLRDTED